MDSDDSSLDIEVEYDPEEEIRPRAHSFIRLLPPDAEPDSVYAEPATLKNANAPDGRTLLANDQLNLTVNVLHLRRLAEAESGPLADRVGELEDVRDALEALLANEHASHLLHSGGPLPAYLKGLYLFCGTVAEAFEDALAVPASRRDLRALGWRLAEAAHFYFDGLTDAVRLELLKARKAPRDLANALEELFFAAGYLHAQIARLSRMTL
jgi:hypothetical protein